MKNTELPVYDPQDRCFSCGGDWIYVALHENTYYPPFHPLHAIKGKCLCLECMDCHAVWPRKFANTDELELCDCFPDCPPDCECQRSRSVQRNSLNIVQEKK